MTLKAAGLQELGKRLRGLQVGNGAGPQGFEVQASGVLGFRR